MTAGKDWITALREDATRLAGLLSDPQPGLATWHAAVSDVIRRISSTQPGETSDRSEQVPVTRIGGSFGVDLTALRHAIANGATTLTFTAPEGWHFEDDRRLHPDEPEGGR